MPDEQPLTPTPHPQELDMRVLEYSPETAKIIAADQAEYGRSGTFLAHGYLSLQDYNIELTGVSGINIYDKMRKGDATVRISLRAVVLPIMAAHWSMEPASDSQKDQDIANFIDAQLLTGDYGVDWQKFMEEALNLQLSYGRMVYEKVFELVEWNGSQYIGWKKFASRHPRSIMRWAVGQGDQEQFGITQNLQLGPNVEIPGDKLIVLVHEQEGDNWEGTSLLRSAHKHWYMKDQLYRIDAIAHERQGMGIPFAQVTADYTPNDTERALVRQALSNLRAHERSYVEIPAGYTIGWMDMHANTTRVPKDSIEHHDRQIVKNVMAQFIEIGGTGGGGKGSLAASSNQMDLFVLSLQAVADNFRKAIQQSAIKQLVDLNWPGYGLYPKLKVDKVGPDNAVQLADTLLKLVQSHVLTPTDEDEEFMRDVLNFPDLPDELVGTIDRSFQPVTPPAPATVDDGTKPIDPNAAKKDQKPTPEKKANEAVEALRREVRAVLYG